MRMQQQPQKPIEIIVDQSDSTTREADMQAVTPHLNKLIECAAKHPSPVAKATADMWIGMTGKLESVRFEPAEIDSGPLGGCLRDVLQTVAFARRNESSGLHLDIGLSAKKR